MGREELHITIPSLFRCPISMEVMKSPVSLSTGVTYDRSNIQHWLESGHDTCPATMQVLPSKHLVPNLTLHRLIHLWLHHHHSSPRSPSSSSPRTSSQQVRILIDRIEDENNEADPRDRLTKILNFARASEENRRFLADFDHFVEGIIGVLSKSAEMEVLELVITVLDQIMYQNGVKERVCSSIFRSNYQNCFSKICLVLRNGSLISKIESARILESLSLDAESKRRIAEKEELLSLLLHLLSSENDPDLHDAVLSCLIAVAVTRTVKARLVRFGLVRVLAERLLNPNTKPSTAGKSMNLLAMVSTCAEGRCAISEEKCAAAVVERLMKPGTEDAVAVLWGMCCVHGDRKVMDVVVKSNGMTKILLVMQSECEGHVRRMCAELVKALRVGCKSGEAAFGLGRYETKTTHIMPC
ncbi:U-box domain-containing protein 28-like [Corylus avellana]|uniref:U-box domain-containing protein 28-like n=1 Tax=Corylus avellana TaxID=13451 RepID=UPI001E23ED82|nr:U-box domain-containing protein 28-like [Corylus avellana]